MKILLDAQDSTLNQCTAFRRDLSLYLRKCTEKGHEILLLGDFNEPFGTEILMVCQNLQRNFQLIDLMASRHSSSPPATYARGRTRLDYALATSHVAKALSKSTGYEAFNERFHTDHRVFIFDFDTRLLLGTDTQPMSSPVARILKTSNVAQVTQYIKQSMTSSWSTMF